MYYIMYKYIRNNNERRFYSMDNICIPAIAKPFEKVSFDQFKKDMANEYPYFNNDNHIEELQRIYDDIKLPTRSTFGAAGYDFYSPFSFKLGPGNAIVIPTGIRVDIDKDWWLMFCPKSGIGFRHSVRLSNTIGVDDSDYYYSNNEGHIFIKLEMSPVSDFIHREYNEVFGKELTHNPASLEIGKGDKFIQGIFLPYGITTNDLEAEKMVRDGGFGSTGK